jgi:hypothetical protein
LLREIALEGAAEFRTDGHAARRAAAALEKKGWESDPRADPAVAEYVTDGQRQHLGNPEAKEHLRGNEGTVPRIDATDVPDKTPFFPRSERAGAGELSCPSGANAISVAGHRLAHHFVFRDFAVLMC